MTEMMEPLTLDDPDDFEERKNTGRVVVALPAATEPIHHLGDVDEPKHMTMVWLGKPEENPDLDMDSVNDAVRDVAEQSGGPLTGLVSGTGQLGDQDAQVVFLHGDDIHQCHDALLTHPTISAAHTAVEQHPGFTPHTTLGYGPPDPANNNDISDLDQVVYDRLGVWDGDEHTEYPLGPSASSEENTEPEDTGLDDEFLNALTEAMTKPIVINGPEDLVAAIKQCDASCGTAQTATRPILMKRARELGCQHVIPLEWTRARVTRVADDVLASNSEPSNGGNSNVDDVSRFVIKHQLSGVSDTALRAAYIRGVREYTMTAPQSRPPLPRHVIAQARVNSLIRLAQGDLSARTDDRDLLP